MGFERERKLSFEEAAELCGTSTRTLRRWANEGEFGEYLETIWVDKKQRKTSLEAIERFRQELTRNRDKQRRRAGARR